MYTVEYYSTVKKNEFMKCVGKWIVLRNIILSGVTKYQKYKHHMFSHICGSYLQIFSYDYIMSGVTTETKEVERETWSDGH